jgi:hypothetical protein
MTDNEIYNKIENMYDDEKSKKFIIHLIYSYCPVEKVEKVWHPVKGMKCCITGQSLMSVDETLGLMHDDAYMQEYMENLKRSIAGEPMVNTALLNYTKGRILGFTGKDTKTFMCEQSVQQFYNFISTRMIKGDRTINGIIKRQIIERGKELDEKNDSRD